MSNNKTLKYVNSSNIAPLLDVSAVKCQTVMDEVIAAADVAKKYSCKCAFAMPNFTPQMRELLKGSGVSLGGAVGFPSGADTTAAKVFIAKELAAMGCDELDMVIAVGALKSGMYDYVLDDIKAIREVAEGRIFKCIIEVSYLTDDEIKRATELVLRGGADFVKSGTGWSGATSVEHIKIMKSIVGNDAKVKAAGGVRDIFTIDEMVGAGCERFGIGAANIEAIFKQLSEIESKQHLASVI